MARIWPGPSSSSNRPTQTDRKSTRLNSSHVRISYAVFCLKKKKKNSTNTHLLHQQHRPHDTQADDIQQRPVAHLPALFSRIKHIHIAHSLHTHLHTIQPTY